MIRYIMPFIWARWEIIDSTSYFYEGRPAYKNVTIFRCLWTGKVRRVEYNLNP